MPWVQEKNRSERAGPDPLEPCRTGNLSGPCVREPEQAIIRGIWRRGTLGGEPHRRNPGHQPNPGEEAIHKLEREGLLRKLPHGDSRWFHLSREDIEETFGIRCVLESYAARLAALNHRRKI